jgi:RNA polymerase sigma-70 factor (ECF subfamily)
MEDEKERQQIADAKNNPLGFEPLYTKYYPDILRFVYRRIENLDDCREVTATVFTKSLLNIDKYKNQGFPFSSWLYRIALNEISQFYRDADKMRVISIDEKGIKNIAEESGQWDNEQYFILKKSLQLLSEDELRLIELRFFEGRSFAEICQILEITENNAKVKTYRALDKLREAYTKIDQ